jgi:enoyl-CoA hydratase/carnithine racemase
MSLVRLELCDGVGIVTLDNPPLNLITRRFTRELDATLCAVEANIEVRTVVVCGAGSRAFSVGSDIKEFTHSFQRGASPPGQAGALLKSTTRMI